MIIGLVIFVVFNLCMVYLAITGIINNPLFNRQHRFKLLGLLTMPGFKFNQHGFNGFIDFKRDRCARQYDRFQRNDGINTQYHYHGSQCCKSLVRIDPAGLKQLGLDINYHQMLRTRNYQPILLIRFRDRKKRRIRIKYDKKY